MQEEGVLVKEELRDIAIGVLIMVVGVLAVTVGVLAACKWLGYA